MTRHTGERGQILPLVAICLVVLMGFAGMAVDVGYLQYAQHQQQNAADAAAIAGAQEIMAGGSITTAVRNDAQENGFTNGTNGVQVTAYNPPQSGPFAGVTAAVQVTVQSPHQTFFGRLFGLGGGETTQAVGLVTANNANGCIYLLNPAGNANFNGGNVTAPCGVLLNPSSINMNGATLDANTIGYAGSRPNENGATFPNATPAPMLQVADPCSAIVGCAYLTAHPPDQSGCQTFNGNGYHGPLNSGCYSNLNLNGATVTMSGTYVFTGSQNFNGATLTGSNVTIYVAAGADAPNFNGANVTLSPPSATSTPATGNYPGVLYYQAAGNTNNPNFNGGGVHVSGLVYAPGASSVNYNGSAGGYLVLVVGGGNFNGSNTTSLASPPPGGGLIRQAVLAY
jgi:Flp pilus assembly protein TadG